MAQQKLKGGRKMESDSESDADHDDLKHAKLLQTISSMHAKKKLAPSRSETSKVSEFHTDISGKVEVHELVHALPTNEQKKRLRGQLRRAESKVKTLETPMHRHKREQLERETAYEGTKEEISKWQPVITKNRRAEQIQFPLSRGEVTVVDTEAFVSRFQSKSTLEDEVARLLGQSEHVIQKDEVLTEAEKRALSAMSLEEAKERRIALQKQRALISNTYAKQKRQAKIKSRSYHRILRKEKTKRERQELDDLLKNDPAAFLEKMEEIEKSRIMERMSLKHKVKSRRLRKQAVFSKYDNNMRDAVQDMIRKGQELTQKQRLQSDDDEEPTTQNSDFGSRAAMQRMADPKNPWMSSALRVHKPVAISQLDAVVNEAAQHAEGVSSSDEEDTGDHEGGPKLDHADDSDSESDALSVAGMSDEEPDVIARKKQRLDESSDDAALPDVKEGDDIDAIFSKTKKRKKKRVKNKVNVENTEDTQLKRTVGKDARTENKTQKQKENKKEFIGKSKATDDESDTGAQEEGLELTTTRRQELQDFEGDWYSKSSVTLDMADESANTAVSVNQQEETKKDRPEARINPEEFMSVETSVQRPDGFTLMEEEDGDRDEEKEQRITIAQAFADDDVMAEFEEEKRMLVESEQPTDVQLALPGWGHWGGEGLDIPKTVRDKKTIKAPQIRRADDGKKHVIISRTRDNKAVKHQINKLPFPYNNAETYEAYIRQPLGKTWNPETAYSQLTKPKIITKLGQIIDPISKEEIIKQEEITNSSEPSTSARKRAKKRKKTNNIPGRTPANVLKI